METDGQVGQNEGNEKRNWGFSLQVFRDIKKFLLENGGSGLRPPSDGELSGKVSEKFPGILKVDKISTPKGREVFVVYVNRTYYPRTVVGPGYSIPNYGKPDDVNCIFICGGFSPEAEDAILQHEIYHIDNADRSHELEERYPALAGVFAQAHEIKTVFNTSVKRNFQNSARFLVEFAGAVVSDVREQIGRVFKRPPKE